MYLLVCDETNLQELEHVKFFIYGGLLVDADAVGSLSEQLEKIRQDHGFEGGDSLKFRAGSRPRHISRKDWDCAKGKTLQACLDHDVRLVAVLVHHKITLNDRQIGWQLNHILAVYNAFLKRAQDVGLLIMDRLPNGSEYELMSDRFRFGSETPWGHRRRYSQVVGYAATCDGASHLASATDVTLGTLGYCVNERRDDRMGRPRELFSSYIAPMLCRCPVGSAVRNWGLTLSPLQPRAYSDDYRELEHHLKSLGLDS